VNNWRSAGHVAVGLMIFMTAAATEQQPAGQGRRALTGDLTKPISQYSGDEFFALVNRLNYTGGQERARACRGNAACAQARRTNVRIDAVADADSLGVGTIAPFGVVALKAVVRGTDTESRYGMLPSGANGRYSYYLILQPGGAGATRWRLEELSVQGNVRTHRTLREGRVRACNHPFARGARADFRTCEDSPAARPASFGNLLQGPIDPPIWFACIYGCCTAEELLGV
jgi:hypothetical protein